MSTPDHTHRHSGHSSRLFQNFKFLRISLKKSEKIVIIHHILALITLTGCRTRLSHSALCPQPPMGEEGSRRRRLSSSAGDDGRRRRHPSNSTSKPSHASKSSSAATQNTPKENTQKSGSQGKKAEPGAGKKESAAPSK